MFEKVLVANRGEIACRIMGTLRRMGVRSVALYTDADAGSLHVAMADEAVRIGDGPVATSYLDMPRLIEAGRTSGADAVHPGYGFLSEHAGFAAACGSAGLTWIGPSPEHIGAFGDKQTARALARAAGVPVPPGSGLLGSAAAAVAAAARVGYPVMLKATAGGGGIGMQRCGSSSEVRSAYESVARLAERHFGAGGVYLERFVERARHVEVQLFGTRVLGLRDCSAQRRRQKVIEETPPCHLSPSLTDRMAGWAADLAASVGYRSVGTVEFVVDADRLDAAFLEVNTRLQVEHGITELVTGVDLVECMVLDAAGLTPPLDDLPAPSGAAIEVRVYAEDPAHGDRPGVGTLVRVDLPPDARVDTWVTAGTEISPWYDPLLAKILVHGSDRADAVRRLSTALDASRFDGVATNLAFLRDVVASDGFRKGGYTTGHLATVRHAPPAVEVVEAGMQTTVQDLPGRTGYWSIGVPPSGPMDDVALRRANVLVGNPPGTAGLEITCTGPTLRFGVAATVALTGAPMGLWIDGAAAPWDSRIDVAPGAVLRVGSLLGGGCRSYLAIAGGVDVPEYLGSRSTFMLGGFGGFAGRALAGGDVLRVTRPAAAPGSAAPLGQAPEYRNDWTLTVTDGPHGAPDFFTPEGIEEFFGAVWTVHHHSDRTGIRLIGPTPKWARPDGGEAGLHPSNIHDTVYAVGTVDFTGDMPVILGPDGPSLGGFVCPVTVVAGDRWKLGQLKAGDNVRFARGGGRRNAVVRVDGDVTVRRAGDERLLIEFGANVLDLESRLRAHALMTALQHTPPPGVLEVAPGIRSLQVRYDPGVIGEQELARTIRAPESAPDEVPSRIVNLPLSWDDPATRGAIERYMQVVRDDAPWCPWNIEFIRRVNGLDTVEDVRRIVYEATYLVLGLGDVYLGAPVATPIDPRHRLVTTKYNPARTWTAENSVGIGGAYLCVYGMEGPGGYQLVGRTLQMWNAYRETSDFSGSQRWLLRFFDQIRFFPVTADELLDLRRDFAVGRYTVDISDTTLSLSAHRAFLAEHADEIAAFKARQQAAFDAERDRWEASGESTRAAAASIVGDGPSEVRPVPDGMVAVTAPVHGVVVRVADPGTTVTEGETVVVVEAMKTETRITTPVAGIVADVRCDPGTVARPGEPLLVVKPA